jgi:hypothetical protein
MLHLNKIIFLLRSDKMPLEGFISDKYFFSPDISLLIESNSKANILDLIKKTYRGLRK